MLIIVQRAVIKESLRLSQGVPGRMPRVVPETGARFCGQDIPPGVCIFLDYPRMLPTRVPPLLQIPVSRSRADAARFLIRLSSALAPTCTIWIPRFFPIRPPSDRRDGYAKTQRS